MKIRLLTFLLLGFCFITTDSFSQMRVVADLKPNLKKSSAFMDASSDATLNSNFPNQGRGIIFPRTDLTTLALEYAGTTSHAIPTNIPDLYDGMLVYNTVKGKAAIGGDSVYVGFYFYRNYSIQTGKGPRSLTNGKWVRVGTAVSGSNSFSEVDNQQLSLANNVLSLTNGGSVTLPAGGGVAQDLSINGGNLELSGSTAKIPLANLGSDTQKLRLKGNTLSVGGENTVTLPISLDRTLTFDYTKQSTDNTSIIDWDGTNEMQARSYIVYDSPTVSGVANRLSSITVVDGASEKVYIIGYLYPAGTNNPPLDRIAGREVTITNTGGVITYSFRKGVYLDVPPSSTPTPITSFSYSVFNNLNGGTSMVNNIGYILTETVGGGAVPQKLSVVGTDLVISGGNTVPLTSLGSDTQKLRLKGNTLSVGGENTVTLPINLDRTLTFDYTKQSTDNTSIISWDGRNEMQARGYIAYDSPTVSGVANRLSSITVAGGTSDTVYVVGYLYPVGTNAVPPANVLMGRPVVITNTGGVISYTLIKEVKYGTNSVTTFKTTSYASLANSSSTQNITNNVGYIVTVTGLGGAAPQTLSINGTDLVISGGNTLPLASLGSDTQKLSLTGIRLSLTDGGSLSLPINLDKTLTFDYTKAGDTKSISIWNSTPTDIQARTFIVYGNTGDVGVANRLSSITVVEGTSDTVYLIGRQYLNNNPNLYIIGRPVVITNTGGVISYTVLREGKYSPASSGTFETISYASLANLSSTQSAVNDIGYIVTETGSGASVPQTLSINGTDLVIKGGNTIPLASLGSDTQKLRLAGNTLSIGGENTVDLPSALDRTLTFDYTKLSTDYTNISSWSNVGTSFHAGMQARNFIVYNSPTVKGVANRLADITIADGTSETIYLIGYLYSISTNAYNGNVVGREVTITNRKGVITYVFVEGKFSPSPGQVPTFDDVSYAGLANKPSAGTLSLDNNIAYIFTPSSDVPQILSLSGNELSITGGNKVTLPGGVQDLSVNGGNLELSGSTAKISLADLGSDTQKLSIVGTNLAISGGNTVPLANLGSDTQKLRLTGNTLSIGGENKVTLPSVLDRTLTFDYTKAGDNTLISDWDGIRSILAKSFIVYGNVGDAGVANRLASIKVRGGESKTVYLIGQQMATATGAKEGDFIIGRELIITNTGGVISYRLPNIGKYSNTTAVRFDAISYANLASTTGADRATANDIGYIVTETSAVTPQRLSIKGADLAISGGNSVPLTNLDAQQLTLSATHMLALTNGGSAVQVDTQKLRLTGNTLSIGGENRVTLPSALDRTLTFDYSKTNDNTIISTWIVGGISIRADSFIVYGNTGDVGVANRLASVKVAEGATETVYLIGDGETLILGRIIEITNTNGVIAYSIAGQQYIEKGTGRTFESYSYNDLTKPGGGVTNRNNIGYIVTITGAGIPQTLSIVGTDLAISGGNTVPLASLGTDTQKLRLTGNTLSIGGENTVTLPSALDRTLTFDYTKVGDNTLVSDWDGIRSILAKSFIVYGNTGDAGVANRLASITVRSGASETVYLIGQQMTTATGAKEGDFIIGRELTITNTGGVISYTLPNIGKYSNTTAVRFDAISYANLASTTGADRATANDIGYIVTETAVVAPQTLSIKGTDLAISGGNTVPLASLGTDTQKLRLTGNRLSIGGENTVTLPVDLDRTLIFDYTKAGDVTPISIWTPTSNSVSNAIQARSFIVYNSPTVKGVANRLASIKIAGGTSETVYIVGLQYTTSTGNTTPYMIGREVTITNTDGVITYTVVGAHYTDRGTTTTPESYSYNDLTTDATGASSVSTVNDIGYIVTITRGLAPQTLSIKGTDLAISGGNTVPLASLGKDEQKLSISGNNLSLTNGGSVKVPAVLHEKFLLPDNQAVFTISTLGIQFRVNSGNGLEWRSNSINRRINFIYAVANFSSNKGYYKSYTGTTLSSGFQKVADFGNNYFSARGEQETVFFGINGGKYRVEYWVGPSYKDCIFYMVRFQ